MNLDSEARSILDRFQQLDGPSITDPHLLTTGPIAALRRRAATWLATAAPTHPLHFWIARIAHGPTR